MARTAASCGYANSRPSRRATILLSVLVVVVIGTLIGTTMTMIAGAQRTSVESAGKRAQARALALSGLRAVVAELDDQRRQLLRGAEPRLTHEWTLFEARDGSVGVVRLLPLGPGDERFQSESAKLDLNTHSAETLARLPELEGSLAQRLAARAEAQPFTSLGGLLELGGVAPEQLFGAPAAAADARSFADTTLDSDGADLAAVDRDENSLADHLTVFAFDPNVQTGLDANRPEQFLGRRRINLNRDWSEDLDRAIRRRYDDELADAVKGAMQGGMTFPDDARMIEILVGSGLEPDNWGAILDGFTAWREPYHYGKVDINRAQAEVIAALPGLDEDVAAEIVELRRQLGEQHRRSVAWPVVEGIMTPEQFQQAGPWLTTRSLQWRVRVMGGFLPAREGAADESPMLPALPGAETASAEPASVGGDAEETDLQALEQAVILEVVIDIAGPTPRIAYLRDVTLYETAAQVRAAAAAQRELERDVFTEAERAGVSAEAAWPGAEADDAAAADPDAWMWSADDAIEDSDSWMWGADDAFEEEAGDNPPPIDEDDVSRDGAGDMDEADEAADVDSSDEEPRRRSNRDRRLGRWRG